MNMQQCCCVTLAGVLLVASVFGHGHEHPVGEYGVPHPNDFRPVGVTMTTWMVNTTTSVSSC